MLSKNFSWSSNLALTIPAKLNGHSVMGIIDTGSSGVIVLQSCVNRLKLKEDGRIAYTLTMPNDTSSQERKIFEGIKIDVGKSSVVLPALVLDGLHYNVLLGVNWLVYTKADLDLKTMTLKTEDEDIKISAYPNPMAGFTAGKLKVYALKFYWLEPGARMMLGTEHETFSLGEMFMFLARENKGFLS